MCLWQLEWLFWDFSNNLEKKVQKDRRDRKLHHTNLPYLKMQKKSPGNRVFFISKGDKEKWHFLTS